MDVDHKINFPLHPEKLKNIMPCKTAELKKFLEEGNKLLQEVRECGCENTAKACEEEWPKAGDEFYYITNDGFVTSVKHYSGTEETKNQSEQIIKYRKSFLGLFKTFAEAQLKLSLVKALCPSEVWVPEIGEKWWNYSQIGTDIFTWEGKGWGVRELSQGNVHKTREQAEAYGKVLQDWANSLVGKV